MVPSRTNFIPSFLLMLLSIRRSRGEEEKGEEKEMEGRREKEGRIMSEHTAIKGDSGSIQKYR